MHARSLALVTTVLASLAALQACAGQETAYLVETRLVSVPAGHPLLAAFTGSVGRAGQLLFDPDKIEGVDVAASPRMLILPGQEGQIAARSSLQYFAPASNGTYSLKVCPEEESPGYVLKAKVTPGPSGDLTLDVDVRMVSLAGRAELPGVDLDVGQPIMASRTLKTRVQVNPGAWFTVAAAGQDVAGTPQRDADRALLVMARVSPEEQTAK